MSTVSFQSEVQNVEICMQGNPISARHNLFATSGEHFVLCSEKFRDSNPLLSRFWRNTSRFQSQLALQKKHRDRNGHSIFKLSKKNQPNTILGIKKTVPYLGFTQKFQQLHSNALSSNYECRRHIIELMACRLRKSLFKSDVHHVAHCLFHVQFRMYSSDHTQPV